jgi:hypothetical protein
VASGDVTATAATVFKRAAVDSYGKSSGRIIAAMAEPAKQLREEPHYLNYLYETATDLVRGDQQVDPDTLDAYLEKLVSVMGQPDVKRVGQ